MTEDEWVACTDLRKMLAFLASKTSDRKRRLFACACVRRLWHLLYEPSRASVETSERYADGLASRKKLTKARMAAQEVLLRASTSDIGWPRAAKDAARDAVKVAATELDDGTDLAWLGSYRYEDGNRALLYDIFGNPFRSNAFNPSWQTATVMSVAQAAYDDRALPEGLLDCTRLAVLSDALEDVGCTDAAILDHLRCPGPHVRGGWALDIVLGKE
jgi:hypothetical protein